MGALRTAACCLGVLAVSSVAFKAGADPRIPADQLAGDSISDSVIENSLFMPSGHAGRAKRPFVGTLQLHETEMQTLPAEFDSRMVLGKDAKIFPGVAISFISVKGDLVPVTQDVILHGSLAGGHSLWDVLVQPGRIWSEVGDGRWSRAAFPFALVNARSGETHNGVAMFVYRPGRVSAVRFEIVQQTSPYYQPHYFTATGLVPATVDPTPAKNCRSIARTYGASVADNVPIGSWDELSRKIGADRLAGFDDGVPSDKTVLAGIDYDGIFYLQFCSSAAGPLPWCDRARFGVWSATKALANELALLRLAQKYGPEVFDLKIQDFVPRLAGTRVWRNVRFDDAANMSTGVGEGTERYDPNDIFDGVGASYDAWHEARSAADKLEVLASTDHPYPWGPGKVARYRDQDMFVLGMAMDGLLKSREGSSADIWTMLAREVLQPVGIHYSPTSRTLDTDGEPGQPLMAFGYYPTLQDIIKISRLYQALGRWNGQQILYRPRVAQLLDPDGSVGLPTGQIGPFGETRYFNGFWRPRYLSPDGCAISYPRMEGFGGVVIALLPGSMTGIRIGKFWTDGSQTVSVNLTDGMAQTANRVRPVCNR